MYWIKGILQKKYISVKGNNYENGCKRLSAFWYFKLTINCWYLFCILQNKICCSGIEATTLFGFLNRKSWRQWTALLCPMTMLGRFCSWEFCASLSSVQKERHSTVKGWAMGICTFILCTVVTFNLKKPGFINISRVHYLIFSMHKPNFVVKKKLYFRGNTWWEKWPR